MQFSCEASFSQVLYFRLLGYVWLYRRKKGMTPQRSREVIDSG